MGRVPHRPHAIDAPPFQAARLTHSAKVRELLVDRLTTEQKVVLGWINLALLGTSSHHLTVRAARRATQESAASSPPDQIDTSVAASGGFLGYRGAVDAVTAPGQAATTDGRTRDRESA